MSPYLQALRHAMRLIADRPRGIIVGQSVLAGGTALRRALDHIPPDKLLELPVMEDSQLGLCTGLALQGWDVLSCYPRWNFLGIAWNQLVEHLDKLPLYGNGFIPRVLIRVGVPTDYPMHPGVQHLGDFSDAFRQMLKTVEVWQLTSANLVLPAYEQALNAQCSTILVEYAELYDRETPT